MGQLSGSKPESGPDLRLCLVGEDAPGCRAAVSAALALLAHAPLRYLGRLLRKLPLVRPAGPVCLPLPPSRRAFQRLQITAISSAPVPSFRQRGFHPGPDPESQDLRFHE